MQNPNLLEQMETLSLAEVFSWLGKSFGTNAPDNDCSSARLRPCSGDVSTSWSLQLHMSGMIGAKPCPRQTRHCRNYNRHSAPLEMQSAAIGPCFI